MKKKTLKKWSKLTKGEQNGFYYVFLGYSKMTSSYDIPDEYKDECEKRKKKEDKAKEKETYY